MKWKSLKFLLSVVGMRLLLQRSSFSTNSSCNLKSSTSWRIRSNKNQLVQKVSSILLQRMNWNSILCNTNLSSDLTQSIFLQILCRTQINPQISVDFFCWTKDNLGFRPNLTSLCKIMGVAAKSGLLSQIKPHLSSVIHSDSVESVLKTLVQTCGDKHSLPHALNFVTQVYADEDLFNESFGLFKKVKKLGFDILPSATNALISSLIRSGRMKSALCLYCSTIRCSNVKSDNTTLELVARIMWRLKKLNVLESMVLVSGIRSSFLYGLIIDLQCDIGDFASVFVILSEMEGLLSDLDFETCSSILNGACKHMDAEIIKLAMKTMEEKGFVLHNPPQYDVIISKLCHLGKSYAAEMFFSRALVEHAFLESGTYGSMLAALSKDGRRKEAIRFYKKLSEKRIVLHDSSYSSFIDAISEGDPSQEICEIVKGMISKGSSSSCRSNVSKFITSLCCKGMWREAEGLLNDVTEEGFLPESSCCCALMNYYCRSKKLDAAILFHNNIEKLHGKLDMPTYNMLLSSLFAQKRVDEATRVFNHMRKCDMLSPESFTITIMGFCRVEHKREAMDLHDEMLRLGIKPCKSSYRQLIRKFR